MNTPSHLSALRHGSYAKPAPPTRKNASASGHLDNSFPPPPPPISGSGSGNDPELTGSNSTTPRGSMENLPPPPPHLLHSDEDEPHQLRDASPQVIIIRALSSSCKSNLKLAFLSTNKWVLVKIKASKNGV